MKKTLLALVTVATLALPGLAEAQIGIAARAGTLGIGGEVALDLGDALVLRGGLGLMPFEVDASSFWDPGNGVSVKLELPSTWYNVGADLYLGGSFRIGGGMLFKSDDPRVTGTVEGTASIDIDGVTYTATDVAEVQGRLVSKDQAPYVLIGFGKHTSSGIGLFLDLGIAFTGDPTVELEATSGNPTIIDSAVFREQLSREALSLQNDLPTYAKYWPILNIGLRIGVGG